MASSIEASDRLGKWKKSRTVLKLTILTKDGIPEMLTGSIVALDDAALLLCFAPRGSKDFRTLDLAEAAFSIGKRKLGVERGEDILSFEELD